MELKRGDRVAIKNLKIGDRFFLASDKKRVVWQICQGVSKNSIYAKTDASVYARAFSESIQVIYLSSTQL